jgi:positive regulator of sigma E activity
MFSTQKAECIEHDGIVKSSGINSVTVSILSASACSGCHAAGCCTLAGESEKIIEVAGSYNVSPGDRVTLMMKQSTGYAALLLGYVIPLVLLISVLIIMLSESAPELTAGLCSIASLIPYYILLWLFRNRISKKFTFSIKD